jgi:hypothetical protein
LRRLQAAKTQAKTQATIRESRKQIAASPRSRTADSPAGRVCSPDFGRAAAGE